MAMSLKHSIQNEDANVLELHRETYQNFFLMLEIDESKIKLNGKLRTHKFNVENIKKEKS